MEVVREKIYWLKKPEDSTVAVYRVEGIDKEANLVFLRACA